MSGIYIPGLSMPRKTEIVSIVLSGDGSALLCEDGAYSEIKVIPVPEHGRLIDADALCQSIKESIAECHKWADAVEGGEMYARVSQSLGTFVECSLRVKAAPTIIPADKEGE